jgi:hypothetical protein
MSNIVLVNILRFIGILLFQGLILRRIEFDTGAWQYIHALIYPLFIILMPLRAPRAAVVGSAFLMGIMVDIFYYSPGIHASAATFLGYIRPMILSWLEPRGGYNVSFSPTQARFGASWFMGYAAIMLAFHLLFYFSVEAFTFVFIDRIVLNTLLSFVISFFFIFVYMRLFDPLD